MVEEIYLIGPGSDKNDFNLSELSGKTVLNFSGDLLWFQSRNIYPTYWTFIDPNTLVYITDNIINNVYDSSWLKGLKENTSILYNDFQGTDTFYDLGMTTSRGKSWNSNTFAKIILPTVCSLFKESMALPSIVMIDNFNSFYVEELQDKAQVTLHSDLNLNTDKFSCFVLPLVLWYFKELKSIKCIGFGDFTVLRDSASSNEPIDTEEYNNFISSYMRVKNPLIQLLKDKNVKITFHNKNTSFYELETATNG